MNPITNIRNQNKLNEREIELGIAGQSSKSWHQKYADSAWVFIGGIPYDLTEGDIIAVFSQYGEVVNINLIRDRKTGKSKGFAFLCYEDQRSTILAVDNFNGTKLVGRMIRVDHVEEYRVPKYKEEVDADTRKVWEEGCAPKPLNVRGQEEEVDSDEGKPLLDKQGLIPLDEAGEQEVKQKVKEEKKKRKQAKKDRKEQRKIERRMKRKAQEDLETEEPEDKKRDLERSWKEQRQTQDDRRPANVDDSDEFYGSNPHFSFGKEHKPIPPPPSHNARPDFDKADWRDIELWKLAREREKRDKEEKGDDKVSKWKQEQHYLPTRFRRQ